MFSKQHFYKILFKRKFHLPHVIAFWNSRCAGCTWSICAKGASYPWDKGLRHHELISLLGSNYHVTCNSSVIVPVNVCRELRLPLKKNCKMKLLLVFNSFRKSCRNSQGQTQWSCLKSVRWRWKMRQGHYDAWCERSLAWGLAVSGQPEDFCLPNMIIFLCLRTLMNCSLERRGNQESSSENC